MLSRILRNLSLRRDNPGKALAQIGIDKRRAAIRARCDQMRRDMGLPAVKWPN